MPIRVVVTDDQAVVRAGFRVVLGSAPDLEVVGEAGDGAETAQCAAGLRRYRGHPPHRRPRRSGGSA